MGYQEGANLYEYAESEPTVITDSSGLGWNPFSSEKDYIIYDWGENIDFACNVLGRQAALSQPNVKAIPGDSVTSAISQLVGDTKAWISSTDYKVSSVTFYGHGGDGYMCVGAGTQSKKSAKTPGPGKKMDIASFTNPADPTYRAMVDLRACLTPDAVIYFKGCDTFAGAKGRAFAEAAANFFGQEGPKGQFSCPNRIVKGHNAEIGYNLKFPGLQELKPGEKAEWPDIDPDSPALKKAAKMSK